MPRGNSSKSTKKNWWETLAKKSKGMKSCPRCAAVYYDGHWHTNPELALVLHEGKKKAKEELCFQCNSIMNGHPDADFGFEGQVVLDGLHDQEEKHEMLKNVRNYSRKESDRNPTHQIIDIDDRGTRVIVTTTENQMAVGIGKSIDKAFKGGDLRIIWSSEDKPARVYWKHKHTVHQ